MPSHSIPSGAARLACDDDGAGSPLVLLHPGVADRRCWQPVTGLLAGAHRVVRYDRRGFGATTYEPEPHDQTADLVAVLDGLGLDRVVLVGNSRGGHVAIEAGLAVPDRVGALVLVAPAVRGAPAPELTAAEEQVSERSDELEAAGDRDAVNRFEAHVWLDGPFRPEGTVGDPARALFLEMNGRALAADDPGPEAEPAGQPAWERLGELTVPVLVVVGAHDFPYQVARSRQVAQRVPGAGLRELPGSAHLPQLDDPGGFVDVVLPFLREVLAGQPPAGTGQT